MSTIFTHNGVEITLGDNGKFSAKTPAGRITAESLAAIKRILNKRDEFKPFKAFLIDGGSLKSLEDRTVTGIVKARGRYKSDTFQTDKGTHRYLYLDTPENREAATAYIEMMARHAVIKDQLGEEEGKAAAALIMIKPGDELPNESDGAAS